MEPILETTPAEKTNRKSLDALKAEISMRMRFLGLTIEAFSLVKRGFKRLGRLVQLSEHSFDRWQYLTQFGKVCYWRHKPHICDYLIPGLAY